MSTKLVYYILIFFLVIFLLLFRSRTVFAANVVINEFMAHPSSGSDWIELYNTSPDSFPIDNWKIIDTTSVMITLSGTIAGNGFAVFEVSNRLNNGGDMLTLKDQTDTTLDSYLYTADPGIGVSIGRQPDGIGGWVLLSTSTKGFTNTTAMPMPTPTLTPTPSPTLTPAPKTPTSVPTTKTTSIPTLQPTSLPSFTSTEQSAGESGKADLPLEILGENIVASSTPIVTKKISGNPSATPASKILGGRESNLSKVLIGLGVIFLLACGILIFRKLKIKSFGGE